MALFVSPLLNMNGMSTGIRTFDSPYYVAGEYNAIDYFVARVKGEILALLVFFCVA